MKPYVAQLRTLADDGARPWRRALRIARSGASRCPSVELNAGRYGAGDFTLPGSDGRTYHLIDFRGRQAVVLAWFPKAFTGGCTAECESIGASDAILRGFNVQLFRGQRGYAGSTNAEFAASRRHDVSDSERRDERRRRALTACSKASGFPSRWTFYIGLDGRILEIDNTGQHRGHTRVHDVAGRALTAKLAVRLERHDAARSIPHAAPPETPRPRGPAGLCRGAAARRARLHRRRGARRRGPRVRRAAVAKLMDPAALAGIARDDADESVRDAGADHAARHRARSVRRRGRGAKASRQSTRSPIRGRWRRSRRRRSASRSRLRALSRLAPSSRRASAGIDRPPRRARNGPAAAFERLRRSRRNSGVAMNSEFKDTAMAAVDRLADRGDLEQVVARAKNRARPNAPARCCASCDERAAREAAAVAAAVPAPAETINAEAARARADQEAEAERRPESTPAQKAEELAAVGRASRAAKRERAAAEQRRPRRGRPRRARSRRRRPAREAGCAQKPRRRAPGRARPKRALAAKALTRLNQLVGRSSRSRAAGSLAQSRRRGAARRAGGARRHAAAAVEAGLRRGRAAAEGRAGRPDAEGAGAARSRRLAALGQRRGPGTALREDGGAAARSTIPKRSPSEVRELQEQWRQAADVPRAQADALWRRFKAAHDERVGAVRGALRRRGQARAREPREEDRACASAPKRSPSRPTGFRPPTRSRALQAEWKTIGPVSRGQEKAIWERFRAACDRFFTRRHEDLAQRKATWAENLAKKEALCARSRRWPSRPTGTPAAAEIKRLQAEWKTIGPVKKSRSEAIWQRFRAACDRFFARYAQRHDIARAERVAAREAICAELEALAAIAVRSAEAPGSAAAPPAGLADHGARRCAPLAAGDRRARRRSRRARALDRRFAAAFDRVMRAVAGGVRRHRSRSRREPQADGSAGRADGGLAGSLAGPARRRRRAVADDRLAAMLKEALAANTIGGKVDDDSRLRAARKKCGRRRRAGRASARPDAPSTDRFQSVPLHRRDRVSSAVASTEQDR